MKRFVLLLLHSVLLLSLVACGDSNPRVPTEDVPAPPKGALIATETTCKGFHVRFALVPDVSITDSAPDAPVVRGVRWTMAVMPPPGLGVAPTLTMESFTVHAMAGAHRDLHVAPPLNVAPPWQWNGTVGITALPGGIQGGDYVNLFPGFSAGAPVPGVAWLGMELVPGDGGVLAGAARIVKPAPCPSP